MKTKCNYAQNNAERLLKFVARAQTMWFSEKYSRSEYSKIGFLSSFGARGVWRRALRG